MNEDERYLSEAEHSRELATAPYLDTEIKVSIRGPRVDADEYREVVRFMEVAKDREPGGPAGWDMLSLPTDPDALDDLIDVLDAARDALDECETVAGGER